MQLKQCLLMAILGGILPVSSWAQPFTVVALPSTQHYSDNHPETFKAQTQWVADHQQERNIAFLTHLGNVVAAGAAEPNQWTHANDAMRLLDGDPAQYPQKRLPYSVCQGILDLSMPLNKYNGAGEYLYFFGPARYYGCDWYGGSNRTTASHYQRFVANGRTWLHLNLEVYPDDETLLWAQRTLDANPTLPAIVSTHAYITDTEDPNTGIPGWSAPATINASGSNSGYAIWKKLIQHNDQIVLVLCSDANGGDGDGLLVSQNIWGREVAQMCVDYQNQPNGGDGWLRLIEIDEAAGQINVATWSPTLNRYKTDAASQYSLPLDLTARLGQFNRRETVGSVQAANLQAVQLRPDNEPGSVIVSVPAGQSTAQFVLPDPNDPGAQTNRGDYVVQAGSQMSDDTLAGVWLTCVAEHSRMNETVRYYHTAAMANASGGYNWVAIFTTSRSDLKYDGGFEDNVNVNAAWFPFASGWLAGQARNLDNNAELYSLTASPGIELGKNLLPGAGMARPYGGGTFSGTGVWELRLPGINSMNDGVLLVCGGKNEDNYASCSPSRDGSGWSIIVHDNGADGASCEQDPFNFVYIPYETPGIAAGVVAGRGGIVSGTNNFRVEYLGKGTTRLTVDGHTPATGTLLICSGTGSYADDNIVTCQPDGDGWRIEVRDLPGPNLQTNSAEYDAVNFAFIPFQNPPVAPGPARAIDYRGLAAADFEVVSNGIAENVVYGGVHARDSRNRITAINYDRGDYNLAHGGNLLNYTRGVWQLTARQTGRNEGDGTFRATLATHRTIGVTVHKVGAGNAEFNLDFAAAWFPFTGGFTGGHVDKTGMVAASSQPAPAVTASHLGHLGRYALTLGNQTPQTGLLFAIAECNASNTASVAPLANGMGWDIATRQNAQAFGYLAEAFAYLYLPFSSHDIVLGHVQPDAAIARKNGLFSLTHPNPGEYRLSIPNASPQQGILLLNGYQLGADGPAHTLACYETDGGDFIVKTFNLSAGAGASDTGFIFAYIPFDAAWGFPDAMTDMADYADFASRWLQADSIPAWDYNANGRIDTGDLARFGSYWLD